VQGLKHHPAYRDVNLVYRKSLLIARARILFIDFILLIPDSGVRQSRVFNNLKAEK
jgi:hypothetical protein